MMTSKTLDALRTIDSVLRAVADIPIPNANGKIGDRMHALQFDTSRYAPMTDNFVIEDLLRPAVAFTGKIWANPDRFEAKDHTVILNRLIAAQNFSNGKHCIIAVLQATIADKNGIGVPMALKCRQVSSSLQNQHFTEREGTNVLALHSNPDTRDLFASLVCILSFQTDFLHRGRKARAKWEAIGTELLARIPNLISDDVYAQCFFRLKTLHAFGYVHGDPHIGNFMVHPTRKILMIDQDEVRQLPNEQEASKYFQILDYLELLYWANPSCVVFSDGDAQRMVEVCMQTADFIIAFPPYGFLEHRGQEAASVLKSLEVPSKANRSYLQFLADTSISTIDDYFEQIFSTVGAMKNIEIQATGLHHAFTNAANRGGKGRLQPVRPCTQARMGRSQLGRRTLEHRSGVLGFETTSDPFRSRGPTHAAGL